MIKIHLVLRFIELNLYIRRCIIDLYILGGALGELVQWTDLIGALYILGHRLTITYEATNAKS